jgi:hypothetical protein
MVGERGLRRRFLGFRSALTGGKWVWRVDFVLVKQ